MMSVIQTLFLFTHENRWQAMFHLFPPYFVGSTRLMNLLPFVTTSPRCHVMPHILSSLHVAYQRCGCCFEMTRLCLDMKQTYDRILREEFTTDADNSSMVEKIAQYVIAITLLLLPVDLAAIWCRQMGKTRRRRGGIEREKELKVLQKHSKGSLEQIRRDRHRVVSA